VPLVEAVCALAMTPERPKLKHTQRDGTSFEPNFNENLPRKSGYRRNDPASLSGRVRVTTFRMIRD